MPNLPGALLPFTPFPAPVDLPAPDVSDAPLVCVQINEVWMQYVIGCVEALTAQSTWASDDENAVNVTIRRARNLIDILAGLEACPMEVRFRLNPTDNHYWDYSNDGGATWTRQPDTVSHFTPVFTVDGASPGGFDLSVNGGLSSDPIPLLTATDPTAIIVDPSTTTRNTITAGSTVDGLQVVNALDEVAAAIATGGFAAYYKRADGIVAASGALVKMFNTNDYTQPVLEVADT